MAQKHNSGQVYHTATYNRKTYTATPTEWGRIIDCPMSWIERGLRAHGSMQAVIDIEFAEQQRKLMYISAFTLGVPCHG